MKKIANSWLLIFAVVALYSCNSTVNNYLNQCNYSGWRVNLGALGDSTIIESMADISGTVCEQIVADCEVGEYKSISIGCIHVDDSTSVASFDMNFFREATVSVITFGGDISSARLDSLRMDIIAHKSSLIPVVEKSNRLLCYVVFRGAVIWSRYVVSDKCQTCIPTTE